MAWRAVADRHDGYGFSPLRLTYPAFWRMDRHRRDCPTCAHLSAEVLLARSFRFGALGLDGSACPVGQSLAILFDLAVMGAGGWRGGRAWLPILAGP